MIVRAVSDLQPEARKSLFQATEAVFAQYRLAKYLEESVSVEQRKQFCERLELAVQLLPQMERFLIEQRYMCEDAEYVTDHSMYTEKFNPPIGEGKYAKIRIKAMSKLALSLNLDY